MNERSLYPAGIGFFFRFFPLFYKVVQKLFKRFGHLVSGDKSDGRIIGHFHIQAGFCNDADQDRIFQ